jgi:hypothetical protein
MAVKSRRNGVTIQEIAGKTDSILTDPRYRKEMHAALLKSSVHKRIELQKKVEEVAGPGTVAELKRRYPSRTDYDKVKYTVALWTTAIQHGIDRKEFGIPEEFKIKRITNGRPKINPNGRAQNRREQENEQGKRRLIELLISAVRQRGNVLFHDNLVSAKDSSEGVGFLRANIDEIGFPIDLHFDKRYQKEVKGALGYILGGGIRNHSIFIAITKVRDNTVKNVMDGIKRLRGFGAEGVITKVKRTILKKKLKSIICRMHEGFLIFFGKYHPVKLMLENKYDDKFLIQNGNRITIIII